MNRNGWFAAATALALAVSACGPAASPGAETQTPPAAAESTGTESPGAATPEAPAPEPESPGADETTEPAEEAAPQPENDPAPEPAVEKDYYMDGNYVLRPKDEAGDKKVVLLTFDDGPKEEAMLESMLDTLDRYEAKAIFFINGYRAEKQPELVRLLHDRGQTIGNHSWDHIDLKKQTQEEMERQIDDVQSLVQELVGEAPVFFRPPFGSGGDAVKAKAEASGLLYMTWSNGSRDWMRGYDEPQKVVDSVLEQLHPGSNILMHELPWTDEALDELLSALRERGYSFLDPARIDPDYSKN
ncbi:polysaccharide deacetylase family protein [Paenibacillus sp.]|uniref:polysaccharide deacetylase family protein n=1 Tax=Paenibacillus sp. TaxID=58172 RepID=UPI002D307B47|nr:polysaccharide deacetylase family protein [Paenibacillus sp.]HZG55450.1 polysaccharide deacetylase family protein [Paenibacillus sp.]